MTIQELKNYSVTSIHYPSWVDYFDWRGPVEEEDALITVNHNYILEKDRIAHIKKLGNRITVTMTYGQQIILNVQV